MGDSPTAPAPDIGIPSAALASPGYWGRRLEKELASCLEDFPAVAILGPRQCGKTTLARRWVEQSPGAVYLDLERASERRKLTEPELYFKLQQAAGHKLFCLDEVQCLPEIFPLLRSLIDEGGRNGQFLILGSASPELLHQTAESLAGRIVFLELTPFLVDEAVAPGFAGLTHYWLRGGFPRSLLARSEASSYRWRESFIRTFLERDIPQLGIKVPSATIHRLWRLLAHSHGQLLNSSKLGAALGTSHTTLRSYIDLLTQTFMVRVLEPLEANVKKRLVKSPKVYLRDSGVLHSLLGIKRWDDLLGHPIYGSSWEGLVLDNAIAALPGWEPSFYRTGDGAELDLVLTLGQRRVAIECKATLTPELTRGGRQALADLGVDEAWIIAPVDEPYPLHDGIMVSPPGPFLAHLRARHD